MLNAPDMGEREQDVQLLSDRGEESEEHMREERPRGTVGRNIVTFRSEHFHCGLGAMMVDCWWLTQILPVCACVCVVDFWDGMWCDLMRQLS